MPAGRPKIDLDVVELEKLAALQCTYEEAAAWFGVCKRTFVKKLAQKHYRERWEHGQQKGLISLRRTQFRLAEKSAGMAIFLGKNYLGQRNPEIFEHTGKDGGPIETRAVPIDYTKLSDDELAIIHRIAERTAGSSNGVGPHGDSAGNGATPGTT